MIASSFAESYIDKETGNRVFEPDFLYELEEYESFMSFYKALQGKSLVEATLPEGKVPAVQVLDGNPIEIANTYGEEYYVMQTSELYAGVEEVFASKFAVSEHSSKYDRAMQILYLLQDNAEIRTALQYGIEDVDYTIELNDDNQKEIKVNERTSYKMNILYTGNGYRTYPADGSTMDDWKEVIDTNLSVTLDPFFMLRAYIDCNLLSDEQAQQLTSLLSAVSANNKSFKETIDSFTAEEFEAFVSAVGKSISSIEKSLSRSQDQLLSAQENLADAQSRLESAESDEEKAEIQEEIEGYQTRITRYVTDIANYQSQLDIKKNHPELDNAMEDKNQEDLLDLYKDIYSVAK